MKADLDGLTTAGRSERCCERLNWRHGFRDRKLEICLGTLQLRLPKLPAGGLLPSLSRAPEDLGGALMAAIQETRILVLDNAGWHGRVSLAVPDGIRLGFLPPYSPELQPAERFWPLVDEPIVNRHVETLAELNAIIGRRCRRLDATIIKPHTIFAWWPAPANPH